ncbi:FAD-dependent oxidoreductase [Endozoicomonas sp. SCSIO W0465]|uniref:FAD-dependent oxidoreductase n=1 Tax=Endozoicomonas sp. SCSIO W0465 TaxID=2918516 RepID=UPI0035326B38
MAKEFTDLGGEIQLNTTVTGLAETSQTITAECCHNGERVCYESKYLITCSGLLADRMTKMLDIPTDFQIIPYRGEYYRLSKRHNEVINHLIYPIPDPDLPFLGVHLTRMIDGSVTVGPNAVQGWKREGYGRFNVDLKDVRDMVTFPGFWKVTLKHLGTGLKETWESWRKSGYLKRVNKYCDKITIDDLEPYPAGIRAQAVLKDGSLVHDFCRIIYIGS